MKNYFNIELFRSIFTTEDILAANFGLEREGLRIHDDGNIALTEHPKIFGDKLKNPVITTDFSESQVEMVTPTFKTTQEAYEFLEFLTDYVNKSINPDEYIWNQSIPCILPESDKIPIAQYGTDEKSINSYEYRVSLAQRYGTKKQLISGIHYNFSFAEETIKKLYDHNSHDLTYKNFKNEIYLKIVRNYLRYKWFIIYMTGCSIASHESFTCDCKKLMNTKIDDEYYSTVGTSFRNASCGYKNLTKMYPRYDTVEHFIEDVNKFIDEEIISETKELYTQIRLKAKNPDKFLESLGEDGILYLELRTVDINSFDICGISKNDLDFLHLFMIFLLLSEESDYVNWQEEGLINEESIAHEGFKHGFTLLQDGKDVLLNDYLVEISSSLKQINDELNLGFDDIISDINNKIKDPDKLYSKRLLKLVKDEGFINSQIKIAQNDKKDSLQRFENKVYDDEKYKKYMKTF